MKVAVFGAGYVGCVTAACLAEMGHKVWLVEVVKNKLATLVNGKSPVFEPGLEDLFEKHVRLNSIIPTDSDLEAVIQTDLGLICVGTPSLPDGRPDSHQVGRVMEGISGVLAKEKKPYVIVLRSTLLYPQLASEILPGFIKSCDGRYGKEISFALNPEFLREGSAIQDFMEPPFIVIGTEHKVAENALRILYGALSAPLYVVSPGSASLLKYACNTFHAAKIIFANEIASLGAVFEAEPNEVMNIFCKDTILNIAPTYLRPGFAYGGSCLPKDTRAINRLAQHEGIDCPMLGAIPRSNELLIEQSVKRIEGLNPQNIALLGLSFKPKTDDLRESPFVVLAERLIGKGYHLRIYDPDVKIETLQGRNLQYAEQRLKHLTSLLFNNLKSVLENADLVIYCKNIPDVLNALSGVPVLDLTRQIHPDQVAGQLLHLYD